MAKNKEPSKDLRLRNVIAHNEGKATMLSRSNFK